MFDRSSNSSSTFSFSASSNPSTSVSFNTVTYYTRHIFPRAGSSGWSGDFIQSDYYGNNELGLGDPFGQNVFEGIRHFSK